MANGLKKRAVSIMLQGTSSHVGKSVLVAGLCRLLRNMGLSVAPFKAQNMALNSYVTLTGEEIGRAQAFQAEAAGIEPTAEMNPVLLKPTGDSTSQVIIEGRVHSTMSATEYHAFKPVARTSVTECFRRLETEYDVIVIEGAGSPAETNLREGDIANMGMAEIADCPVLLIGDIDRGGVFASLVGTLALLSPEENDRIKGFIINKFRGDVSLLTPGLDDLLLRTGKPTLGVVPYIKEICLPDEDGVALDEKKRKKENPGEIIIKVIKLPRISNFTDFDPFIETPGVNVDFIEDPEKIDGADLVVVPGTKNSLADMLWMQERALDKKIKEHREAGGRVIGICGGLQILGRSITDPYGMESEHGKVEGLGLLDIDTVMQREKATHRIVASAPDPFSDIDVRFEIDGYEIHMGESTAPRPFAQIIRRNNEVTEVFDGALSSDGLVWGSYIHGLFDSDTFRSSIIESLRQAKGLSPSNTRISFSAQRNEAFNKLADLLNENLDIEEILRITGLTTGENRINSKLLRV